MDAQTYTSCCDARRLSCGVACSVNKGSVNVSPSIKPHRAGRLMKNDPGAARHFCLGRSQCGSNLELLDSALLAPSPSATVVADASPIALCTCSSADCAGQMLPPLHFLHWLLPTVLADARHHHISLSHATFPNTFKSRTSLMVARSRSAPQH